MCPAASATGMSTGANVRVSYQRGTCDQGYDARQKEGYADSRTKRHSLAHVQFRHQVRAACQIPEVTFWGMGNNPQAEDWPGSGSLNLTAFRGVIPKARTFISGPRDLPLGGSRRRLVQILPVPRQVFPAQIRSLNQGYLFATTPGFDFLFARNGGIGIDEAFVVNEVSQVVATGEARDGFLFVLPHSADQVACDSCVEDSGLWAVRHDVDKETLGRSHSIFLTDLAAVCL